MPEVPEIGEHSLVDCVLVVILLFAKVFFWVGNVRFLDFHVLEIVRGEDEMFQPQKLLLLFILSSVQIEKPAPQGFIVIKREQLFRVMLL